MKEMDVFTKQQKIVLYHGSKSGLDGDVRPSSRKQCDFGVGFYLGDKETQPKSLVAPTKFSNSRFYKFELDTSDLKIYKFEPDIRWALFIAYNREKVVLPDSITADFDKINKFYDVIVGVIADDAMTQVLEEFFNNTLTDKALVEALKYVELGTQYVLKTQKACNQLKMLEQHSISDFERSAFIEENKRRRDTMSDAIVRVRNKYLRDGKYFVEIVGELQ